MNKKTFSFSAGTKGISNLGTLLTVLILSVCIYFGSQVVPFYLHYVEMEGHMDAMAEKATVKKDKQIREFLEDQMRKMDIPAEPKDLRIQRGGGYMLIELYWEEVLVLDLGEDRYWELWTFEFHPKINKKIKG